MTTNVEYALMAGNAYISTRDKINLFPVPLGWTPFFPVPDPATADTFPVTAGFEAISFQNGTEIVISFAGTYDKDITGDIAADIALATGVVSDQLKQAAEYYLQVRAANPGATITLTGHSLGGGLASLMGVFFGEQAVTFDQAPFYLTALNGAVALKDYLLDQGYDDDDLAGLDHFIALQQANGGVPNSHLVSNINVAGEFLSEAPLTLFSRVGTTIESISSSADGVSGLDLHSQALLVAFLQSNLTEAAEHSLSDVTFKLTNLMEMFFDERLFKFATDTSDENFLDRLVRYEFGNAPGATDTDMLTRFTADLWKLAQDGGMTMTDGNTRDAEANELSKTLIVFAMQKYYEETADSAGYAKEFFETVSGGIQFDMADVSTAFASAMANNAKLNLADAKGFALYFSNYLEQSAFTDSELALIKTMLPYLRDWYVQAGAGSLDAADSQNRGAFMLGGNFGDALTGGDGADMLVGNIGNDTLTGGKGNDILLGGLSHDTYVFATGDGLDTIVDQGGRGTIVYDSARLSGGQQYGDARVYKSVDKQHLYTRINDHTLVINGQIVVQDFTLGDLSLSFTEAPAETDPLTNETPILGDFTPIDHDPERSGIQTRVDELGNVLTDEPEPGRADILYDSALNDLIASGGGSDFVYAYRGGDDVIESGDGRDRVYAGAGQDLLIGGAGGDILAGEAGDDRIYAESRMSITEAIAAGNSGNGSGMQGDWLAGGAGDDTLVGGIANDVLSGGAGQDLLIGGAGDDVITGDTDWVATSLNWTVTDNQGNWLLSPVQGTALPTDGAADVIYAGQGSDRVYGGIGNDVIFGEGGNDFLFGNSGNDVVSGGDGHDQLSGDEPSVVGEQVVEGSDILFGDAGNDSLFGNGGDDILVGGTGNDSLYGGQGMDTYVFNKGDGRDVIFDSKTEGNILRFGAGFNPDNVTLRLGSLMLDLGDGDAVHIENFDRKDVFNSSSVDTFAFSDGAVLSVRQLLARGFDLSGTDADDLLFGTNTLDRMQGLAGNDQLQAGEGDDQLDGGSGADSLWGGDGDDQLIGGEGADYLSGAAGDDTYVINLGDGGLSVEGYTEAIADNEGENVLAFGAGIGIDDVQLKQYPGMLHVIYSREDALLVMDGLSSSVREVRFADGSRLSMDALYARNSKDAANQSTSASHANLVGSALDNWLSASGGGSTFRGGRGDDTLVSAGGGNLYIYERGDGVDHIHDAGVHTLPDATLAPNRVRFGEGISAQDLRLVPGVEGTVEVLISGEPTGKLIIHNFNRDDALNSAAIGFFDFADGTSLSYAQLLGPGFQLFGGVADDVLLGSNLSDMLQGHAGNDTLVAGAGDDSLHGGEGDDLLQGGAGADLYFYARGQGSDTLLESADGSSNTLRLAAGLTVDDIELAADAADNLMLIIKGTDERLLLQNWWQTGHIEFADGTLWTPQWIRQNLSALIGSQGNDVLTAFPGRSVTLYGIDGNDTLVGDGGDDQLLGGTGSDTLRGGLGNDSYLFDLGDGSDTLVESGGIDNVLYGRGIESSEISVERVGADLLLSHVAGDELRIQDWFTHADGRSQVEEIRFADGLVWTAQELTTRALTQNGTEGDDLLQGVEHLADHLHGAAGDDALHGFGGDDFLYGGAGNDSLLGGAGHDNLYGGSGNDLMQGGEGDDIYHVDASKDVVVEYTNQGVDTVYSSIRYALDEELEHLTLTGLDAIKGTGNALDNRLTGNSAANSLSAGAGNDTLDGGAGNDTLIGGLGNDTYLLGRGYGSDSLIENDASADNLDVARFLEGIEVDQLWFREVGKGKNKDLEVSVIGTDDRFVIERWYGGDAFHVEQFQTADGKVLLDSQVQNLVNAMAVFAPPPAGQTSLSADYRAVLDSVIAANWQ
jgi:Ca2+-binding RTX toxin-like protein